MSARVVTFSAIHVGTGRPSDPYAVVIADDADRGRVAARADGDLSWLAIGETVEIEPVAPEEGPTFLAARRSSSRRG